MSTTQPFDVLAIGRSGVDIYPLQIGVGLEDVETFGKFLGGSAANVAVAAARLGNRTALISGVGDDPFGKFVRAELAALGVDNRYVATHDEYPTPVTFCEIFPPDNFPLYFYRKPSAPDLQIQPAEIDADAVRTAGLYWSTVTGLSEEPSRSAHFAAWEARDRAPALPCSTSTTGRCSGSRPPPPPSRCSARCATSPSRSATVRSARSRSARPTPKAADALLDLGVELAIVKQGPRGVLGKTRHSSVNVPPNDVDVVNGLGAGDAFGGSLCHGLLHGWPLEKTLRYANAAGAIVASRLECSTAMPTAEEVAALAEQTAVEAVNV